MQNTNKQTKINKLTEIKGLLTQGFNAANDDGNTALILLIQLQETDRAVKLINTGRVDVNQAGADGQTPLIGAILSNDQAYAPTPETQLLVRALMDRGADPTQTDDQGKDAIRHATDYELQPVIDLLEQSDDQRLQILSDEIDSLIAPPYQG